MQKNIQKIHDILLNFLKKYDLLSEKTDKFLIGFSGGGDSLCLLDAMHKTSHNYGFKTIAAHLNHNWRPEEARQEQELAQKYCQERGIEFYYRILPPELPQTEEEARYQRYKFFNEIALQISATAIFTGHTATDNVETVLYRIIKGTGLAGLKGIPEKREQQGFPPVYRPLLAVTRDACTEYCRENSLTPSFDSSNLNKKYLRNRIRLSLLPELVGYNPAIRDSILRLSAIAGESEEIIKEYLIGIKRNIRLKSDKLNTKKYLSLSNPVKKRLLVDFLEENHIEHTFERIEELFSFIQENTGSKCGKTFSIGKDTWFFVSIEALQLVKKEQKPLPSLKITEWQENVPDKFPKESEQVVFANLSRVKGQLRLRYREPGDRIQPFGMGQKTKLKKYLINRGIPKHERDNIPLLADDEEVLWVVGVGISELLRVDNIPTHVVAVEWF